MNINKFEFKKSLGQNFLKDTNVIEKIVNCVDFSPKSLVIEIGPGAGALTKKLVEKANTVLAYEIDNRLAKHLTETFFDRNNISFIFKDFLTTCIKEDIKSIVYDEIFIVANLPYYITTPIINKIIDEKLNVKQITIMVQKEVGDRFTAEANCRDYSSLSIYLNYYFNIKKEFVVSRNCFIPVPNVDSIIVTFNRKEDMIKANNEKLFFQLIRDSFKFKRKNLRNNLKEYNLSAVETCLSIFNKDLTYRAEQITINEFIELSNYLNENK